MARVVTIKHKGFCGACLQYKELAGVDGGEEASAPTRPLSGNRTAWVYCIACSDCKTLPVGSREAMLRIAPHLKRQGFDTKQNVPVWALHGDCAYSLPLYREFKIALDDAVRVGWVTPYGYVFPESITNRVQFWAAFNRALEITEPGEAKEGCSEPNEEPKRVPCGERCACVYCAHRKSLGYTESGALPDALDRAIARIARLRERNDPAHPLTGFAWMTPSDEGP